MDTFEKWWESEELCYSGMTGVMQLALKEISKKAWAAGITSIKINPDWEHEFNHNSLDKYS